MKNQKSHISSFIKNLFPFRILREFRGSILKSHAKRRDRRNAEAILRLLVPCNPKGLAEARFGSRFGDGGYVIRRLDPSLCSFLLSYGVNDDVSFETDFSLSYPEAELHLFDHTVESPVDIPSKAFFHKQGLSGTKTSDMDTLDSHIETYIKRDQVGVLKIDIEGSEYDSLLAASDSIGKRFSQVAIEIHNVCSYNLKVVPLLQLMKRDFHVVHVHPNNTGGSSTWGGHTIPKVIEIIYINRSLVKCGQIEGGIIPSKLDLPNDPRIEDIRFDALAKLLQRHNH